MNSRSYTVSIRSDDDDDDVEMRGSIRAVENMLNYKFSDKTLIEKALTHPSYVKSESYQRLEFVGDAALGLAITNFAFLTYPQLHPGDLSVLRAANISTEKLARVAVRHQLYKFVRHNSTALTDKVLILNTYWIPIFSWCFFFCANVICFIVFETAI